MKRGNLRTVKKYGGEQVRYSIEGRINGCWRQLRDGGVVLIFDTEDEAIRRLLAFFNRKKEIFKNSEVGQLTERADG